MAIISISRQVASLGDEIASAVAKNLGYRFVTRHDIEKRIVELGFSKAKLEKYDERKPGFFASLAKDRDEYLNYLQTAVLEAASQNNCILIGRAAFVILDKVQNLLSVRLVANEEVRVGRLMKEFSWNEKQAKKRINESDTNRAGFFKSFFNYENDSADLYHAVFNTGSLDMETVARSLETMVADFTTIEKEDAGMSRIEDLLIAQRIVNMLIFDYGLAISFLHAAVDGKKMVLHGVADSAAMAEHAVTIAQSELPSYRVESAISVVQNFKAYPQ